MSPFEITAVGGSAAAIGSDIRRKRPAVRGVMKKLISDSARRRRRASFSSSLFSVAVNVKDTTDRIVEADRVVRTADRGAVVAGQAMLTACPNRPCRNSPFTNRCVQGWGAVLKLLHRGARNRINCIPVRQRF